MAFNFVGEVDSVRERQKEFISEVLVKRGFKNCDVSIEPVGKAGDNFIANVKRIVVNYNGEAFKMIAKLAPETRHMMDIAAMFKNEHVIYTEVFPKFKELQKSAGVPENDWFRHAECYGTFIEAPNEVILLEDLKETKLDILNKFKPIPTACVKLVLKNFAVLHSLSFVLKNQEPESFAELISNLGDLYDVPAKLIEMRRKFGQQIEANVLANLSDDKYRNVFKGTLSKFYDLSKELADEDKNSQYSVIQQGDGWTNNIMFTFENNQPSQCVLIDYQMARESNPLYDIMYMIFNSTESKQRIELYTEFIDCYYNELDKSLNNYGLKASDIYPREQLNADMKRCAKLIIAMSVMVTTLIVKDVEEAKKWRETVQTATDTSMMSDETIEMVISKNVKTDALFRTRIEGLAKSVVELGLL